MTRWLIVENQPGCLPEGEPWEVDTDVEAWGVVAGLGAELEVLGYELTDTVGAIESGYLLVTYQRHVNDPGRVIEATEVTL